MKYVGIVLLVAICLLLILLVIAVLRTLSLKKKETYYELSTDEDRCLKYAEKLSKMIQCETVSHREDPEIEKFLGFHQVMRELFPRVFEKLEYNSIEGNLLLKWKGTDSSIDPIVLMSHQDVVPAEGEWKYPPYSGTIAEGKVWGRGASDTKCSVMAFYQAVEEMLEEGYEPKCDVYLVSSRTEEIGGDGATKMVEFLKERGVHIYMLCDEGGSIVQDPIGGVKGNFAAVGIFEKGYGDLKFIARSNGGHSSYPGKNTPIPKLAAFENAVEKKNPFTAKFTPAVDAMFDKLAPYCSSFGLKLVMSNLWLFKPLLLKVMPAISPQAAAMLRTTIAFTMQEGSKGYNVLPQEACVYANLRYIPHQSTDEANKLIADMAAKYGLETEIIKAGYPSKALDLKGEQFKMVEDTIAKIFPGVGMMPYVVTGGTDARFWGDICDACVRFSPINYGPEQMKGMHGLNENIEIGTLPGAVDYYKAIIMAQEGR